VTSKKLQVHHTTQDDTLHMLHLD